MLTKGLLNKVTNQRRWIEGIMIAIMLNKDNNIMVIGVYGPNYDDTQTVEGKFWV